MPEPMSPEGPRQPIVLAPPEQPTPNHEIRKFSITVDGEERRYPENYPFQFITDGAPRAIREIMGGMAPDTGELGHAINAYLLPSQEIFENTHNLPKWYQQTLGPVLERNNIILDDLKPADIHLLGDDFRWALEDIYNFSFSKQLQIDAAQSMGQTEGKVPTLSVLIQKLQRDDPEQFAKLMETLLKRGPDGFVMAAYLVAPTEEKAEKEESPSDKFSFDKIISTQDGQSMIDTHAMRELINTAWKGLHLPKEDISFDASSSIINTKAYKETSPKE